MPIIRLHGTLDIEIDYPMHAGEVTVAALDSVRPGEAHHVLAAYLNLIFNRNLPSDCLQGVAFSAPSGREMRLVGFSVTEPGKTQSL